MATIEAIIFPEYLNIQWFIHSHNVKKAPICREKRFVLLKGKFACTVAVRPSVSTKKTYSWRRAIELSKNSLLKLRSEWTNNPKWMLSNEEHLQSNSLKIMLEEWSCMLKQFRSHFGIFTFHVRWWTSHKILMESAPYDEIKAISR